MVVTSRPAARKAGIRQECTGVPSSQTVQAPQSPAVAPFLHAEAAMLAQEGAQALARLRRRGERPAVNAEAECAGAHGPTWARSSISFMAALRAPPTRRGSVP